MPHMWMGTDEEDPDQDNEALYRLGASTYFPPRPPDGLVKLLRPSPELRSGLDFALVFERSLTRPQHFADRGPGHGQVRIFIRSQFEITLTCCHVATILICGSRVPSHSFDYS